MVVALVASYDSMMTYLHVYVLTVFAISVVLEEDGLCGNVEDVVEVDLHVVQSTSLEV